MIDADPLAVAMLANDAARTALQAGPPADLPAQVPDFVTDIMDAVRSFDGGGGLGETIRDLTPGGAEMGGGPGDAANESAR